MSRRVLSAVGVGATLLIALTTAVTASAAPPPPPPSPWSQAQYNAAGSNANLAESTLTPQTVGTAVALRSIAPVGRDCYGRPSAVSPPLITSTNLYAVNGTSLESVDIRTGAPVWRTPLSEFAALVPIAVTHGLVIVGGNDCGSASDPLGTVQAFRASDGSPVWTLPNIYSDAVTDVSVSARYVVVKSSEFPDGRDLSVFHLRSGRLAWTVSGSDDGLGNHTGTISDASARVVDEHVFVNGFVDGFARLQVRALATGRVIATDGVNETALRGDSDTSAATVVYASFLATVDGLDPATAGSRYLVPSATSTLAVDNSRLYATCASDGSIVCGYDKATGGRRWVRSANGTVAGAISAGGLLYLSTGQVLNAGNGHLVRVLPGVPVAVGEGLVAVQRSSGAVQLVGLPGR